MTSKSIAHLPTRLIGGPYGLTPQHITDVIAGDDDGSLINALTDLTNQMLAAKFDTEIDTKASMAAG